MRTKCGDVFGFSHEIDRISKGLVGWLDEKSNNGSNAIDRITDVFFLDVFSHFVFCFF